MGKFGFGFGDSGGGGGGGGGTVTSFTAGNLSPLFTTSVVNETTTPSLSFTLVSQNQNLVYASPNGSGGSPSFRSLVAADLPSGLISGLTASYVPYASSATTLTDSPMSYDGDGFHLPDDTRIRVGSGTNRSNIRFQTTTITLKGSDVLSSYGQISVGGTTNQGNISLFVNDAGASKSITVSISAQTGSLNYEVDGGLVGGGFAGITYTTDYSANYTVRSLVDKAYVDSVSTLTGNTGDIISFSATNTKSNIAAGAAGTFLRFAGVNTLPTASTLTIPNTSTANRIVYSPTTSNYGDSSLLTFDGTIFTANALKSNANGMYIGGTAATSNLIGHFESNQNAVTALKIVNTNTGTAGVSRLQIQNSANSILFNIYSIGYTSTSYALADGALLYTNGSNGLNLVSEAAGSGSAMRFYTGGSTERVRLISTGEFIIGGTALISNEVLSIQKNQNAYTSLIVSNTNGGANANTQIAMTSGTTFMYYGLNSNASSGGGTFGTANMGYVSCPGAGGLEINAYHATTSVIKFSTGGNSSSNIRVNINNSGNTFFGGSTSATALVHIAAGTTAQSQLRLAAGVAPSSPNDGDIYYIDTNDRLMFRKNATDAEVISASAVTTESVASNTTLTVTYNGTTYKLLATT